MTTALMTPEQYLRTSFDGLDCEYVDGEIVERYGGEQHSKAQVRLVEILYELRKTTLANAFLSLRLKLSETRYRIPDISIFAGQEPTENIPSTPPSTYAQLPSRH